MKNLTVFLIVLLAALWVSCEKVLDPSDFEDEFGDYRPELKIEGLRPELKIEGLLQQDKPEDSIVRVDKTITFTDKIIHDGIDDDRVDKTITFTDKIIHDGIDDDGDGEIDEEDEVLPLIHDTSATVKVTNLNSGEVIDFHYLEDAGTI
ncbi:MAG: hypothetical protein JRE27_09385, partial [Deltaproteobacteria bacterium]|nr:hypothetical protein [Deltaproteobacteria bacterium]